MRSRLLARIFQLVLMGLLVLGILLWATPTSESAIASVLEVEESPQAVSYWSQHRVRDQFGETWQVIFYKQVQPDQPNLVSLRLVGLPGAPEVNHPVPLTITTPSGQRLSAADIFLNEAPAPTIAQYDMKELASQFSAVPVRLTVPVIDRANVDLDIPLAVIKEWLEIVTR
jgi:Protein of unknown function (DUF3122)